MTFPTCPFYAVALGGACCDVGELILDDGNAKESLAWFDRAQAALEGVLVAIPNDPTARNFLRNTLDRRAEALEKLGRKDDAAADREKAAKFDPEPKSIENAAARQPMAPTSPKPPDEGRVNK
jgi:hypothetical protein